MKDNYTTKSHYLTQTFLSRRLGERTLWTWEPESVYKQAWPFHSQEWSMSNFPCSLTRHITSHSRENLAFRNLLKRRMMTLPILTTWLIHFSLEGWENVLFELLTLVSRATSAEGRPVNSTRGASRLSSDPERLLFLHRTQKSLVSYFPLCKTAQYTNLREVLTIYWLTWWVPQNNNSAGAQKLKCFILWWLFYYTYVVRMSSRACDVMLLFCGILHVSSM